MRLRAILLTFALLAVSAPAFAVDLTGTKCKKTGQTKMILDAEYKCVKQGKKLAWKKQSSGSDIYGLLDKQIQQLAPKVSNKVTTGINLISETPTHARNNPNLEGSAKSLQLLRTFSSTMPDYEFYTYETVGWINNKMTTACPRLANQTEAGTNVGASVGCGKLVISNLNGWNNKVGPISASWFEAGHEAFHLAQYHWALDLNNSQESKWYWGATDWYREGGASVFGAFVSSLMNNGKTDYGTAVVFERSPYKYNECKDAWNTWQISNEPGGKGTYNNCEYGLGRRMMDLLVAKHGGISGILTLYSELGKGSNFETAFEKAHDLTLKAFFTEAGAYMDAIGWKQ